VKISGYMYKFQDLTPISGHFRTNFKISEISGQRPGLQLQHVNKSTAIIVATNLYKPPLVTQ